MPAEYRKDIPALLFDGQEVNTVTTTNRPFNLQVTGIGIYLTSPGSVTGNIYINGVKKATATGQTRSLLGSNFVDQLQVIYTVN